MVARITSSPDLIPKHQGRLHCQSFTKTVVSFVAETNFSDIMSWRNWLPLFAHASGIETNTLNIAVLIAIANLAACWHYASRIHWKWAPVWVRTKRRKSRRSEVRPLTEHSMRIPGDYGENARYYYLVSLYTLPGETSLRQFPRRVRREREVDYCQADEDHTFKGLLGWWAVQLSCNCIQELARMRQSPHSCYGPIRHRAEQSRNERALWLLAWIYRRSRAFRTHWSRSWRCRTVIMARSFGRQVNGTCYWILPHGFSWIVRTISRAILYYIGALTLYSFFEEVPRICAQDYLPNEMDVLRARTKTTGIYETRFQMGALSIQ